MLAVHHHNNNINIYTTDSVLHALSHLTLTKTYHMNITSLIGKDKKQDVKAGNRQSQGLHRGWQGSRVRCEKYLDLRMGTTTYVKD